MLHRRSFHMLSGLASAESDLRVRVIEQRCQGLPPVVPQSAEAIEVELVGRHIAVQQVGRLAACIQPRGPLEAVQRGKHRQCQHHRRDVGPL